MMRILFIITAAVVGLIGGVVLGLVLYVLGLVFGMNEPSIFMLATILGPVFAGVIAYVESEPYFFY